MAEDEFQWVISKSKITVPHEDTLASERCAQEVLRAMRSSSKALRAYHLSAAHWFAMATTQQRKGVPDVQERTSH